MRFRLPTHLSPDEARARLDLIYREEHHRVAEGLALLALIDSRRDSRAAGYSCMKTYCEQHLRMTPDRASEASPCGADCGSASRRSSTTCRTVGLAARRRRRARAAPESGELRGVARGGGEQAHRMEILQLVAVAFDACGDHERVGDSVCQRNVTITCPGACNWPRSGRRRSTRVHRVRAGVVCARAAEEARRHRARRAGRTRGASHAHAAGARCASPRAGPAEQHRLGTGSGGDLRESDRAARRKSL